MKRPRHYRSFRLQSCLYSCSIDLMSPSETSRTATPSLARHDGCPLKRVHVMTAAKTTKSPRTARAARATDPKQPPRDSTLLSPTVPPLAHPNSMLTRCDL